MAPLRWALMLTTWCCAQVDVLVLTLLLAWGVLTLVGELTLVLAWGELTLVLAWSELMLLAWSELMLLVSRSALT